MASPYRIWHNARMDAAPPTVQRSIRLVRPPGADGVGVFCVRDAYGCCNYTFKEIPCAIGGRGFAVHKLGFGSLYHVRVGEPEDCSCECLGFCYRNRCRHVLGLLALVKRGQL